MCREKASRIVRVNGSIELDENSSWPCFQCMKRVGKKTPCNVYAVEFMFAQRQIIDSPYALSRPKRRAERAVRKKRYGGGGGGGVFTRVKTYRFYKRVHAIPNRSFCRAGHFTVIQHSLYGHVRTMRSRTVHVRITVSFVVRHHKSFPDDCITDSCLWRQCVYVNCIRRRFGILTDNATEHSSGSFVVRQSCAADDINGVYFLYFFIEARPTLRDKTLKEPARCSRGYAVF